MLHTLLLAIALVPTDSAKEPDYIARHEMRVDSALSKSSLGKGTLDEWNKSDAEAQKRAIPPIHEFVWQDDEDFLV